MCSITSSTRTSPCIGTRLCLQEDVSQEAQVADDYRGRLVYELLQNADDAMRRPATRTVRCGANRFTPPRDTAWRARWGGASRCDGDAWAASPVAATVLSALRHPVHAAARRPALLPLELQDAGLSSTAAGGGTLPRAVGWRTWLRLLDAGVPVTAADLDQSESYWNRVAEGIHLPTKAETEASP